MNNLGLILLCSIPAVIGICTIVYALFESAVLVPLRETILIVPIYNSEVPVSEMLRVIQYNSFGHTTIVADMHDTIHEPQKLIELGLCDEVTDPEGVAKFLQKRFDKTEFKAKT